MSQKEHDGKTAVITGASKGIGKAIAKRLHQEGCRVILVASNADRLAAAAREFDSDSDQTVEWVQADLGSKAGCEEATRRILTLSPELDILINCAGATKAGSFPDQADEDWIDGFDLKFFGAVRLCRGLWGALKAARGTVINIGGGATYSPSPGFMVGGSVNVALAHFSKALSMQGLADDVNVNVIHPGMTVTDRMETLLEAQAEREGISVEEAKRKNTQGIGIRRLGLPEDVAELAHFLCTEKARHIQGTGIAVDGGATSGFH